MKIYDPSRIRNIILLGHAGSGKTTLAETMVFESGTVERRGNIENGSTLSDFHSLEKERGKSVFSSLLHLDWRGTKINLIDTPGTRDFIGEVTSSLSVADSALFVLSADAGVEAATESLWKRAEEIGLPSMLVVNRLDQEQSGFQNCVDMARERFGRGVVVVQYPFSEGSEFHAIIDVLKMTMYEFPEDGGRPDKLPIPESQRSQAQLLHNELVELIAENDESLMDLYFEKGELDEYQMREGLQKAMMNRDVFPMFAVAAGRNMGTGRIMSFINNVLPSPLDANPVKTSDGESLKGDPDGDPVLVCFKTYSESHVGHLTYFKVVSGKVSHGLDLENSRDLSSQRIGALSIALGEKRSEVSELTFGDLGVALKLKDVQAGDTLAPKGAGILIQPVKNPLPVMRKALQLKNEGDEDKLGTALGQLQKEDPSLMVEHSQELHQTILNGQGEEHLSAVMYQLQNRFKLDVDYVSARIPYRETITKTVRTQYKHKKQSGGAGQYAEVYLLVEPWREGLPDPEGLNVRDVQEIDLQWGGKLVFLNCIVGGVIDNRFMPAILKGIMEKMESGPMSGCRARDIRVSVYDGSMHSVDSNEAAFKTAALMAFKEAFMQASPQLLEPVYSADITVPADYMGDVMSDLSSRRGQIQGMDAESAIQNIHVQIPLDELGNYSTKLKSMTQGSATYTIEFSHYAAVPRDIQERVIQENIEL